MRMKNLQIHFSFWIRNIMCLSFCGLMQADSIYQLIAPREYVAFSGDLSVHYKTPDGVSLPDAFIRLVLIRYPPLETGPEEITTLGMDDLLHEGTVRVTCGIIEVAGKYEFHMLMHLGGPILTRAVVIVRWPPIIMELPVQHYAHTSSVQLSINSSSVCNPLLKRYGFQLKLEYASKSSYLLISGKVEELSSKPFSDFSVRKYSLEFPCFLFDLAGVYRVSLISNTSAISVVSRSNYMLTNWSPAFKLIVHEETVFPCYSNIKVNYIQPSCPGAKQNNKIRMYKLRRKYSGSLAAPLERLYVEERLVDPDKNAVIFSCDIFDTSAVGYCFVYVTIGRHDIVTNQTEKCLSAHPDSVFPVDGGWSQWSEWSACSHSCGRGKSSRYRMCNNPTPNFGGAFCPGDSMVFRTCNTTCLESIPFTPLHDPKVDKNCACGCDVRQPKGEIIASGRCEGHISRWLLVTEKNHRIKLKFKYFSLYENKQWVKIRNGGAMDSDLIAYSDGRSKLTHVTSTSNQMLIEFYTESAEKGTAVSHIDYISEIKGSRSFQGQYLQVPTKPVHVHGFIASFSSNVSESDGTQFSLAVSPILERVEPSLWESTVTIVGIVLCSVIVVTVVAFAIYHRACQRHLHKYDMAMQEESPKHLCKSTSLPSSPSHASSHGIEIEHCMEIPLTGGHPNGKKKKAYTPGSTKSRTSLTSACSNNIKKLKTKVEIEYNNRRQSPLTPNRDYSQVPQISSPTKDAPSNGQKIHGHLSLFKTSPLVKPKGLRSPKIHSSPKVKKDSAIPVKNDEVKVGDNKRIVMGADLSPTSQNCEVETPTNINNGVVLRRDRGKESGKVLNNAIQSDNHTENNISLKHFSDGPDLETERKPASGTSDDSTSAEKDTPAEMTTSFIESGTKPRRPTSLTESYSKMSIASAGDKNSSEGSKEKTSVTSSDDRQNALPKPDGQSPKSPRVEVLKSSNSKTSTPSKSIKSLRSSSTDVSNKTKSPARSINTPSDVVELEYDDFIDYDDTYSYFDPLETEKLTWHGVEKVGAKTPNNQKDVSQTRKT